MQYEEPAKRERGRNTRTHPERVALSGRNEETDLELRERLSMLFWFS